MFGASAGSISIADSRPKAERRHTKEYRAMHIRSGSNLAMSFVEDRTDADSIMAQMKGERRGELAPLSDRQDQCAA